jgi:hypothetical protein
MGLEDDLKRRGGIRSGSGRGACDHDAGSHVAECGAVRRAGRRGRRGTADVAPGVAPLT